MSYHLISSVPTTCTTSDLIIKLFKDNHKEEPEYTNQDEIVTAIKEAYNIDTKQPAVSKALQKLIGSQFEFDKQTYILYKGYASYEEASSLFAKRNSLTADVGI